MRNFTHTMRKLRFTLNILLTLFLARTFGHYKGSVYSDGWSYACYRWRGKLYAFTTAIELDEEENAK